LIVGLFEEGGGLPMKEFVEFIAKRLVDHPDQVSLEQEEKDNSIVVRLKVDQQDVGKVIGRKGRTAQSLRTLLAAVAAKDGKRAILEIAD
jgi:predicted RNA-binding protein YlqC (UPF0109 family)